MSEMLPPEPAMEGTPEGAPFTGLSAKELDRMPIIDYIRRQIMPRVATREFVQGLIDKSHEPNDGKKQDRLGQITGRDHEAVSDDAKAAQKYRLRQRQRSSAAKRYNY